MEDKENRVFLEDLCDFDFRNGCVLPINSDKLTVDMGEYDLHICYNARKVLRSCFGHYLDDPVTKGVNLTVEYLLGSPYAHYKVDGAGNFNVNHNIGSCGMVMVYNVALNSLSKPGLLYLAESVLLTGFLAGKYRFIGSCSEEEYDVMDLFSCIDNNYNFKLSTGGSSHNTNSSHEIFTTDLFIDDVDTVDKASEVEDFNQFLKLIKNA